MAMVIPRSRSSGALSIESKARYSPPPFRWRYLVIAAVSVVLPWSMWPIVPILTCGLLRSNFSFAIILNLQQKLFSNLALHPADDLFRQRGGNFLVLAEVHRKTSAPLRVRANIGGVAEHLRKRHHRLDDLSSA